MLVVQLSRSSAPRSVIVRMPLDVYRKVPVGAPMVRIPSLSSYESPHGSLTSSRPVYKRDSSGVYSRLPRIAVRPLPSVIARRVVVVFLGRLGRSGRR